MRSRLAPPLMRTPCLAALVTALTTDTGVEMRGDDERAWTGDHEQREPPEEPRVERLTQRSRTGTATRSTAPVVTAGV